MAEAGQMAAITPKGIANGGSRVYLTNKGSKPQQSHGRPLMKVLTLKFMSQAALLAIFSAAAAQAGETGASASVKKPVYSKEALQGKIEFCQTCHGSSGEGARGGPAPIPRLAGQQIKYLENQLTNFMLHRRQNNVMSNVAHDMSPALITALAAYFNGLNPKPLGPAQTELAAAGKKLYEEGLSEAKVPACANCHGPDAKGNGQYPRLAGQLSDYISRKLTNWDKERQNPEAPNKSADIMEPVAHNLSETQVAAVAAYLANLE